MAAKRFNIHPIVMWLTVCVAMPGCSRTCERIPEQAELDVAFLDVIGARSGSYWVDVVRGQTGDGRNLIISLELEQTNVQIATFMLISQVDACEFSYDIVSPARRPILVEVDGQSATLADVSLKISADGFDAPPGDDGPFIITFDGMRLFDADLFSDGECGSIQFPILSIDTDVQMVSQCLNR